MISTFDDGVSYEDNVCVLLLEVRVVKEATLTEGLIVVSEDLFSAKSPVEASIETNALVICPKEEGKLEAELMRREELVGVVMADKISVGVDVEVTVELTELDVTTVDVPVEEAMSYSEVELCDTLVVVLIALDIEDVVEVVEPILPILNSL